jgi:tetratricopeptide (TPR) repeat protein
VENARKDIRIVNLSLLNTDWYIIQLKHQMGIKVSLEDDQIKWIPAERRGSMIYYRPAKRFYDKFRNKMRYLTPEQDPRTGRVMRVQDQMIEQIIIDNFVHVPIYFSGSVPSSNRWIFDDKLVREGIVLRVEPDSTKPRYNLPVSDSLITRVYWYRGQDDLTAYKDDNNVGLTTTFPERYCELSDQYKAAGDTARALEVLWEAEKRVPYYHQIYVNLQQIYRGTGDTAMVDSVKNLGISNLRDAAEAWPDIILYQQFLGVYFYQNGMPDSALARYRKAYQTRPDNSIAFRLYRDLFFQNTQRLDMRAKAGDEEAKAESARLKVEFRELIDDWNRRHPEDMEARNFYDRFRNL